MANQGAKKSERETMSIFILFYSSTIKIKCNEGFCSKWTLSDTDCTGKSEDKIDEK